jgi:hypothetical protein
MSGEVGYVINRYWIAEYIQYLQEDSLILGSPRRAKGEPLPFGTTLCSSGGLSSEFNLPGNKGQIEPPHWKSHGSSRFPNDYGFLFWMMRWVDTIC